MYKRQVGCVWLWRDTTGRYLYVVYGNVFSVYDFGADQSQALLTPLLVNSKQFIVHGSPSYFWQIAGIALTATQVWILGRRNATTNVWTIDRYSLAGVRDEGNSDILVRGITDPRGLNLNASATQAWVGSLNGDYVAGLLLRSSTGQRRKLSYDATVSLGLGSGVVDIEIKDRVIYYVYSGALENIIHRRSLSSGATLSGWTGPAGKQFVGIAKAGKFLYVKTSTELYRVDTTQATPTFTRVTGTMPSNTSPMTIVNNRLYVPEDEGSIKYLTLTGSTTAGYTAVATTFTIQSIGTGHGLAGATTGMASYLTYIYQSSGRASGIQALAHGWDYTAGSGDTVGQANDITSGSVSNARIAVDTDGTLYVLDMNQTSKLFGFYPTGAQTANVMNIDRCLLYTSPSPRD